MGLNDCSFSTDRMEVGDWSRFLAGDSSDDVRNTFLVSLLSEAVTRDLPPGWQGPYDRERASFWFDERLSDGTALLIVDRAVGTPIGLLILAESGDSDGPPDVRLGYLFHESAWGKGLATEVVAGFASWCRADGTVRSIIGGVTDDNAASARVLEKNGFVPSDSDVDTNSEVEYTLTLAP